MNLFLRGTIPLLFFIILLTPAYAGVSLNPERFSVQAYAGESRTFTGFLFNTYDEAQQVLLQTSAENITCVSSFTNITLPPMSNQSVQVTLAMPKDITPGRYACTISLNWTEPDSVPSRVSSSSGGGGGYAGGFVVRKQEQSIAEEPQGGGGTMEEYCEKFPDDFLWCGKKESSSDVPEGTGSVVEEIAPHDNVLLFAGAIVLLILCIVGGIELVYWFKEEEDE